MRACLRLREHPTARLDPFKNGLRRCGYKVTQEPFKPGPRDVLVIWNRRHQDHNLACEWEKAGARVVVAENGYTAKDPRDCWLYALALWHHNGAGWWYVGTERRYSPGVCVQPWRDSGRDILVLPQRGIGPPGVAMPRDWAADVAKRLRAVTDRPVKVRQHPGNIKDHTRPLAWDLVNVWGVVTWGSGAAIKAIIDGIPAFYEFDRWIGGPGARFGIDDIEAPFRGDRAPMLHRLAWAQWNVREIEDGAPFRYLLRQPAQEKGGAADEGVRGNVRRTA